MATPPSTSTCKYCGAWKNVSELKRCSACSEVYYCSKEHQAADWPKSHPTSHKKVCTYVQENPTCFGIEVEDGEGNGLINHMTNHAFPNKSEALSFISTQLAGKVGYPLSSEFAERLGWNLELYCSTAGNEFHPDVQKVTSNNLGTTLNGAGVYLTCDISRGLAQVPTLNGKIYVIGRRYKDGKPLVSDSLWGLLNFIWDMMDFYETGDDVTGDLNDMADEYKGGRWEPSGGSAGANVYATNPRQCGLWDNTIDHGTGVDYNPPPEPQANRPSRDGPRTGLDDMVESAAGELVRAIRADTYPSESSECIFGIEMPTSPNPPSLQDFPLGTLIYNVWTEIYKRRLYHAGETVHNAPGPASNKFVRELAAAIKHWTIPQKFEEWTKEVVEDDEFGLKAYSTEMKRRGFATGSGLINRDSEGHKNMKKSFILFRDGAF